MVAFGVARAFDVAARGGMAAAAAMAAFGVVRAFGGLLAGKVTTLEGIPSRSTTEPVTATCWRCGGGGEVVDVHCELAPPAMAAFGVARFKAGGTCGSPAAMAYLFSFQLLFRVEGFPTCSK